MAVVRTPPLHKHPRPLAAVGRALARWWDRVPEADKAILAGATLLFVPLVVVVAWLTYTSPR